MAPPMFKGEDLDSKTGEDVIVFEGTACLQYLAEFWDKEGQWSGRTAAEKGAVLAWTAYQTAGIGYVENSRMFTMYDVEIVLLIGWCRATAKYWLYFLRGYPTRQDPVQLPRTIEKSVTAVIQVHNI